MQSKGNMKTQITEIQIIPVKPNSGLVGFASFVYESSFYLGSIGIYTRPQGGYRLTYPTRGNFNIYHPINKQIADEIEKAGHGIKIQWFADMPSALVALPQMTVVGDIVLLQNDWSDNYA